MQAKLGIRSDYAHIAKFSYYMCDQLIAACSQAKQNYWAVAQKEGVLP